MTKKPIRRRINLAGCGAVRTGPGGGNATTRGAALIITLCLLVLVTALVVTMFLSVSNERTESSAAANQGDTRRLSNSVVNLVKSTITQATSGFQSNPDGTPITSSPTAWASQPGLIRTWQMNGTPDASFRLYSSGTIITTGTLNMATELTDLTAWKPAGSTASYNALWCDLNAPAISGSTRWVYPILTPPSDKNSGSTVVDSSNGIPTDDPAGTTQKGVQGYSITAAPGYTTGTATAINNPAPMPVRWFYVLQNGAYVTGTAVSGNTVTVSGATKANPVVGRVAYWTDDETCKVNINTASEGYYWEAPSSFSNPDQIRAMNQPGANEYQRYPGHPATTSLSAIFEKLGPVTAESDASRAARYQKAFNLTPRIAGTNDGKRYTAGGADAAGSQAGSQVSYTLPSQLLALDPDRLYASAEDILFDPTRTEQLVSQGLLTQQSDLQTRLGFLTARSTSPDINWMNKPRISLWPLNPTETSKWSASDKLLAFCATSGTVKYYFERTNGSDPTADFARPRNTALYNYLKDMLNSPIPGASGLKYSSKASRDSQQLLTNIFDYIRCFINTRYVGGHTGSGAASVDNPAVSYYFPPGKGVGTNGCFAATPTVVTDPATGNTTRGPGGFPVVTDVLLHFWAVKPLELMPSGTSQTTDYPAVVPTSGTNIVRTIQMNLLLNVAKVAANDNLSSPQFQVRVSGPAWSITSGPNPATDATVTSGAMNFPTAAGYTERVYSPMQSLNDLNLEGGYTGLGYMYRGSDLAGDAFTKSHDNATRTFSRTPDANKFAFYSDPINLQIPIGTALTSGARASYKDEGLPASALSTNLAPTANPAMMYFNGGTIKIEFFQGLLTDSGTAESNSYPVTTGTAIQTITVNVPSGAFPVPTLGGTNSAPSPGGANVETDLLVSGSSYLAYYDFGSWDNRAKYARIENYVISRGYRGIISGSAGQLNPWLMDVVRGITLDPAAAHKGDLRVITHTQNIPATWFKADYAGGEKEFFLSTFITNYYAGSIGRLDSTIANGNTGIVRIAAPALNGMVRGGAPNVGDFITGRGLFPLGGYYLQPDMGYLLRSGSVPYYQAVFEYGDARAANNNLTYSPARMVGSPVILGKLSTYISAANPNPWETLLFCRNPHGGTATHTGWNDPKDHYILDLFNMPVVEPYAISQPMSTDGRVNLNYQIAPFSYINRSTGLYAAMKGTRMYAIASGSATKGGSLLTDLKDYTVALDVPQTITQIAARAPFITPSEFTEVFLIPSGQTAATVDSYWQGMKGTGDDLREAPYNHIYPKLTTKSNTFTVHMRVQALKQVPAGRSSAADWATWDETKDQVVSEYRGSTTIERYIDPNDATIPDFADPANYTKNLAPYYRWRTLSKHQFVP